MHPEIKKIRDLMLVGLISIGREYRERNVLGQPTQKNPTFKGNRIINGHADNKGSCGKDLFPFLSGEEDRKFLAKSTVTGFCWSTRDVLVGVEGGG